MVSVEIPQEDQSVNLNEAFRPAKRRKFYRRRHDDDEGEGQDRSELSPEPLATVPLSIDELVDSHGGASEDTETQSNEKALPLSELLRLRRAVQRRRGGIEFSNASNTSNEVGSVFETNNTLPENDDALADVDMVVNRFAPQTGQVADVDKHM